MKLTEQLEQAFSVEQSVFRAQLLKEDIARLRTLEELAKSAASPDEFLKHGLVIGWTPGDARTLELKPALAPLLLAFFAASRGEEGAEARLREAWRAFDTFRVERLVGCLSRVPRPDGWN